MTAIGGSNGTLSEIGFALRMGKKVVGLRTWEIDGMAAADAPAQALALDLGARP